jgi:hypothetical protein
VTGGKSLKYKEVVNEGKIPMGPLLAETNRNVVGWDYREGFVRYDEKPVDATQ